MKITHQIVMFGNEAWLINNIEIEKIDLNILDRFVLGLESSVTTGAQRFLDKTSWPNK